MSLATRCTSCNTVFRVVQDQLKVSEGWVRCGRCNEVFNALESLFDLEAAANVVDLAGAPEAAGGGASEPPQAEPQEPAEASTGREIPADAVAPAPQTPIAPAAANELAPSVFTDREPEPPTEPAPQAIEQRPAPAPAPFPAWPPPSTDAAARTGFGATGDTSASRLAPRERNSFEDARFDSDLLADDEEEPAAEAPGGPPFQAAEAIAAEGTDDAAATPEFLRRAEQRARWNRPAVTVAMTSICAVLLLALAGQALHHFRDLVATAYPQTRPALLALCEATGCRIEPLRRIDDIVIESSALTSAPAGDAIRLSVVLRNRGALSLAMPAIELTLTDAAGQMVARRALLPADFGKADTTLSAAAETPLQLVLAVDGRRPSGYTVEPFYP